MATGRVGRVSIEALGTGAAKIGRTSLEVLSSESTSRIGRVSVEVLAQAPWAFIENTLVSLSATIPTPEIIIVNFNALVEPTTINLHTGYSGLIKRLDATSFWPMQETEGTVLYDTLGPHNGNYTGSPGVELNQPGPSSEYNSVYFNGGTDLGVIPDHDDLGNGTTELSIIAWAKATQSNPAPGTTGYIVDKRDSATNDGEWALAWSNNDFRAWSYNTASPTPGLYLEAIIDTFDASLWHMHTYVYDPTGGSPDSLSVYIDDGSVYSATATTGTGTRQTNSNSPVYIGNRGTSAGFQWYGWICAISFHRRTLTVEEIANIYSFIDKAPLVKIYQPEAVGLVPDATVQANSIECSATIPNIANAQVYLEGITLTANINNPAGFNVNPSTISLAVSILDIEDFGDAIGPDATPKPTTITLSVTFNKVDFSTTEEAYAIALNVSILKPTINSTEQADVIALSVSVSIPTPYVDAAARAQTNPSSFIPIWAGAVEELIE